MHEGALALRADTEKVLAFDAQGKMLFEQTGGESAVTIPSNRLPEVKDSIVTHNHPSGLSFSSADIRIAVSFDMAEIRGQNPLRRKPGRQFRIGSGPLFQHARRFLHFRGEHGLSHRTMGPQKSGMVIPTRHSYTGTEADCPANCRG